ncbi:hypothetical protein HY496_01015 [Candidatus Woesearchaeota archaeon]|nr:hypothetical protein [Candidatus Woesearchaeota archaeon]
MTTPQVSLFASAIRPHLWMVLYQAAMQNKTAIEFVFAGNVKPDFALPHNFRFLYSDAKPAECVHLALQQCQAPYVINTSDDWVFGPGAIDAVMEKTLERKLPYDLSSMEYFVFGNQVTDWEYVLFQDCQVSYGLSHPRGMVGAPFERQMIEDSGGIDQRFYGIYVMEDLLLRQWSKGGVVETVRGATCNEIQPCTLHSKTPDWEILKSLWVTEGLIMHERKSPVQRYESK